MEKRVCKNCGKELPFEKFPKAGYVTKTGKVLRRHTCNKCYYKNNTSKQAKKSREWLEEYKKTLSCLHCGNDDYRVLEFHHRDANTKEYDIADNASKGFGAKTLFEEIKKCDVVCANCHRIHHYEEKKGRLAQLARASP